MAILSNQSVPLNKLIGILLVYKPGAVGKVIIPCFWRYTTTGTGGSGPISLYDRDMKLIPESEWLDFSRGSECLDLFAEFLAAEPGLVFSRKVLDDGFLANRLEMAIFPDRTVELAWSFDAEVDRMKLEQAKKYMSKEEIADAEAELEEYFEFKGRSRRMRMSEHENKEIPSTPSHTPTNETESWTTPELFQVIVNTAVDAAPKGWAKVAIDGQVWVDTDTSGRALNNVAADFQAQMPDGTVSQINPQQPIAAMNALALLNKQLPNHEGKPWRRLRVVFESTGPRQVAYDFDQEGLWRPEIK